MKTSPTSPASTTLNLRTSSDQSPRPPAAPAEVPSHVGSQAAWRARSIALTLLRSGLRGIQTLARHCLALAVELLHWAWSKRGHVFAVPSWLLSRLMETRAGKALVTALAGIAVLQLSLLRPGHQQDVATTRIQLSLSLLWGAIKLNSQVHLSLGRPDLTFTTSAATGLQPSPPLGPPATSSSLPHNSSASAAGAAAARASGPTAGGGSGTNSRGSSKEKVHLVCSQELSSTILQFLAQPRVGPPHLSLQQQSHQQQDQPVFYIASPGKASVAASQVIAENTSIPNTPHAPLPVPQQQQQHGELVVTAATPYGQVLPGGEQAEASLPLSFSDASQGTHQPSLQLGTALAAGQQQQQPALAAAAADVSTVAAPHQHPVTWRTRYDNPLHLSHSHGLSVSSTSGLGVAAAAGAGSNAKGPRASVTSATGIVSNGTGTASEGALSDCVTQQPGAPEISTNTSGPTFLGSQEALLANTGLQGTGSGGEGAQHVDAQGSLLGSAAVRFAQRMAQAQEAGTPAFLRAMTSAPPLVAGSWQTQLANLPLPALHPVSANTPSQGSMPSFPPAHQLQPLQQQNALPQGVGPRSSADASGTAEALATALRSSSDVRPGAAETSAAAAMYRAARSVSRTSSSGGSNTTTSSGGSSNGGGERRVSGSGALPGSSSGGGSVAAGDYLGISTGPSRGARDSSNGRSSTAAAAPAAAAQEQHVEISSDGGPDWLSNGGQASMAGTEQAVRGGEAGLSLRSAELDGISLLTPPHVHGGAPDREQSSRAARSGSAGHKQVLGGSGGGRLRVDQRDLPLRELGNLRAASGMSDSS